MYMNNDYTQQTRIEFISGPKRTKIQLKSIVAAFCCLFNVFAFYLVSWNGFFFSHPIIPYYSSFLFFLFLFEWKCKRGLGKKSGKTNAKRRVSERWIEEWRKLCWMNHFCVSTLIDRGTLFKFDGRKVLRNEKYL